MKTLINVLLTLYLVWLLFFLNKKNLITLFSRFRKKAKSRENSMSKNSLSEDEILGKSLYERRQSKPKAAEFLEKDKTMKKENTFAASNENNPSENNSEFENGEKTSAFEEANFMTLDVEMETYDENVDLDDEEIIEIASGETLYSSGVSFEEIDKTVKTINNVEADKKVEIEAGTVLCKMQPTEMIEQIIANDEARRTRIKELIEFREKELSRRIFSDDNNKNRNNNEFVDFDIADFI